MFGPPMKILSAVEIIGDAFNEKARLKYFHLILIELKLRRRFRLPVVSIPTSTQEPSTNKSPVNRWIQ